MRTAILLIILASWSNTLAQVESSPVISNYGIIWDLQDVKKPDPDLEYKILVDLKTSSLRNPDVLNRGLDNVSRMINLHVTGGVPAEHLKVVVAIHGGAAPIVMNNEGYQKHFETDNPNLDLIRELQQAGVDIYVCGQSLIVRDYDRKYVTQEIDVALSMLTLATEKMNEGYHMLVFN